MWLLLEQQKSTKEKQIYFKGWSDYEPEVTDDLQKARRFDSKDDAKHSAAYRYRQSSFVPIEVDVVVKSKAA